MNTGTSANPLVTLGNALSLVHRAMTAAQQALMKNPTKEEERALNATLVDLDLQRAAITAKLDAIMTRRTGVVGPTPDQVAEVSRLAAQVDQLIAAASTASAAVALTSRVLTVATQIASA